jgi:hypothetical protein
MRANKRSLLRFLLFVEKISFIHIWRLLPSGGSRASGAQLVLFSINSAGPGDHCQIGPEQSRHRRNQSLIVARRRLKSVRAFC